MGHDDVWLRVRLGGAVGQQQPFDMRRASEGAASQDERYEQLVTVARRVVADAIPDADQPDQVIVSCEVLETLRAVLANF